MTTPTLLMTGAMALAFCAVHILVGRLRFLESKPRSAWLSFAGGVSVAYVFLHIMPELAAHGEVFTEATGLEMAFAESWVYTLSLAGLVLFYGLERAIVVSRTARMAGGGDDRPEQLVFWLHVGASSVLIFIVSYLLNHREDSSPIELFLYFGALLLHFVSYDFGTREDHPDLYDRYGRWALAAATLIGWITGTVVMLPELAIGCLFAFVGGSIVLVILKEELPEERESRFVPFLVGTVLYAVLVLTEQSVMG